MALIVHNGLRTLLTDVAPARVGFAPRTTGRSADTSAFPALIDMYPGRRDEDPPLSNRAGIETIAGLWHVAHVKSRMEKAFACDLMRVGIAFFLPMERIVSCDGGYRRRVTWRVLFPGYVFFAGDDDDFATALTTGRLCSVIPVHDQAKLRGELGHLHQVLQQTPTLTRPLGEGTPVRITRGPFMGVEGTVVSHAHGTQLVLQVSMLGDAIALEIDPESVEALA